MQPRPLTTFLLTLLAIMICFASSSFSAQSMTPRRHFGMRPERFAQELQLSEAQLAEIRNVQSETEKQVVTLRAKTQLAEIDLRNLMRDKEVDESAVLAKVSEIGSLKTEIRLQKVQAKLAINKLLTQEQRQQLQELERQHRKRPARRRQRDGHPRGSFNFEQEYRQPDSAGDQGQTKIEKLEI